MYLHIDIIVSSEQLNHVQNKCMALQRGSNIPKCALDKINSAQFTETVELFMNRLRTKEIFIYL